MLQILVFGYELTSSMSAVICKILHHLKINVNLTNPENLSKRERFLFTISANLNELKLIKEIVLTIETTNIL